MQVRQVSIFMENRAGRLRDITGILADNKINIRALSLADTSDFGILRIIADNPDKAADILRKDGFTIRESTVIACEIGDKPGALYEILTILANASISVEYMYGFVEKNMDAAVMVLRVEETEKAIETLLENGITLLKGEQIYNL